MGSTAATDDVGGVHYQKVKLDVGGDGVSTPVSGALPVSGTVTAELSATDNAVLDTIDADTSVLAGAVAGGHVQVDVVAAPSTAVTNTDITTVAGAVAGGHMQVDVVGALPAGSAAIGKLAANSGVDIGDVDVLSLPDVIVTGHDAADAAITVAPVTVGGKAFGTGAVTEVSADGDAVPLLATRGGRQYVEASHPNRWQAQHSETSAQTNHECKAAPAAGLSLYITDILISNGATAGTVSLLDGSGGTVLMLLYLGINGGCAPSFKTPIKLTAATALCLTSVTCTTHTITIVGYTAV